MESQSPRLSLDLSLPWLAADPKKDPDKSSRDYISRLEAELRKMEVFGSVLPLSISILTDALDRLKKQAVRNANFEEVPSTRSEEDADMKSWMSSVQLWSSDRTLSLQLSLNKTRDSDKGGAFSSYRQDPGLSPANKKVALSTRPGLTSEPAGLGKGGGGRSDLAVPDHPKLLFHSDLDLSPASALQGPRKQRRCWSPELHRRFVDALDRLGGPQGATPKQIRELMQVDGLTNDEVKSHLQKYRLHLRKFPKSPISLSSFKLFLHQDSSMEAGGGSSAVVNGIPNSKVELNKSVSPEGPFEFPMRSTKTNSPAGRCDSMEHDYEEKSDTHSWEGD